MNHPSLPHLLAEATRLTRAGDLGAATAAIQAALGAQPSPASSTAAAPHGDRWVIDIDAREVPEHVPGHAPEQAPAPGERFIAGSYRHASAGMREYKLYLPPAASDAPLPLVVMLHGCTQHPDDFAAGTGMNDAARRHGFLVLYPAQAKKANPSRCWNWWKHNHQQRERGEPALLAGMTRDVMQRYPVDAQRVYVAGLSAGGAMAAILAQAYPDVYAAVGVHSGLPAGAAHDVKTAFEAMQGGSAAGSASAMPPVIVFHGDSDTTVHPRNGEQLFAAARGCGATDEHRGRSAGGREYTRRSHRDAGGGVRAEHWLLHGGAHAWSGGSAAGSYTDPRGPDATEEMLRFFFAHPRGVPGASSGV